MFGNLAKQAAIFANRDGNLFELGTLLGRAPDVAEDFVRLLNRTEPPPGW